MQPTICSKCKKNVAVVFISRMNEKGEPTNEGLCLKCAAELKLPQVEEMMRRMGITPEDLEGINSEMMQAFGGAEELDEMDDGDEATTRRAARPLPSPSSTVSLAAALPLPRRTTSPPTRAAGRNGKTAKVRKSTSFSIITASI